MSVLPSEADIGGVFRRVCLGPAAEITPPTRSARRHRTPWSLACRHIEPSLARLCTLTVHCIDKNDLAVVRAGYQCLRGLAQRERHR